MGDEFIGVNMHEFREEYKENKCVIKIERNDGSYLKEPYMLLNLERYCNHNNLSGLSHCDFIYVFHKDKEVQVFLVELKYIRDPKRWNIKSILDDIINNKFPQTQNIILPKILKFLNVKSAKSYGVLVLPKDCLNKIGALLSHFKSKLAVLKRRGFEDAWIVNCGDSIWNRTL